ncbi:MAG: 1-acyl-sn-glycerol-3-phosphate acyltransferase [Bdellovibrionales bacterium]|nr:1-acyl-sn-glycerol-3-phosphate acyltransferase [Bdellovibrionales bacterium]
MKNYAIDPADIKEIAPYEGKEYLQVLNHLMKSDRLPAIVAGFFPNTSLDELLKMGEAVQNVGDFHRTIIAIAIKSLLNRTTDGLEVSGLESISGERRHVYVSNHRDIIADSALLSFALMNAGHRTLKICLGDNLLFNDFTKYVLKINKGVIVKRDLAQKELLRWSHVLSRYIHDEIRSGEDSIWIAQREGRTKNGVDKTQAGVLKMLALEGEGEWVGRLAALHIRPVAVSYEYEPCGPLKVREQLHRARSGEYEKAPDEDAQSVSVGLLGPKGRIHISVGEELGTPVWDQVHCEEAKSEQLKSLCGILDTHIHRLYHLFPSNYVAFDVLAGTPRMADHYDLAYKEAFLDRMRGELALLGPDAEAAVPFYLRMYAAPVVSALSLEDSGPPC